MAAKVLVIALDGATFKVIYPLAEAGSIPNLRRLIKEGTSGELRSTMPPVSGPAWHAFKTGRNPGSTGIYDFMRYDPKQYQSSLIQLGRLPDRTLWDIVGSYSDCRIGIYDLPTTYPPVKVNGFMIAGFPLPDHASDYVYPVELKADLDALVNGHKTDIRYRDYKRHEDFLWEAKALIDQRVKAFHYLKDRYDPDLFIFAFTCTDRVQHRMWKYLDPEKDWSLSPDKRYRDLLKDFWRHLDEAIGNLLKTVEKDTTVIVLSDHGFGPQTERFYVNEWLRRQGYLELKEMEGGKQPTIGALSRRVQRLAQDVLKHFPLLKPLRHFVPKRLRGGSRRERSFESMVEQIDWQKTQVYSPPHTSVFGSIYVNLKGREGEGSVEDRFYDKVREEVIARLQSFRDQITDFQIEVFKREDLYHGRYLAQAPDLVYVINNFRCISLHSFHGDSIFQVKQLREDYSGTHRLEGIFIAKGPSIKRGHPLHWAEIVDIAPTLLHILEIPIPEEMDGRVLKELFQPESELGRRDIRFAPAEAAQATVEPELLLNDSVRKRLEDLGYL